MTAPNDLVAAPVVEEPGGVAPDVGESWDDLGAAVEGGGPLDIGFAAAGAGLDTLDAVLDPLGQLSGSAAGFLVEHIGFLQEGLDVLAGNSGEVIAQAQTWNNVGVRLAQVAQGYRDAAGEVGAGWEGAGSAAYAAAVADYTRRLDEAAGMAERLSAVVLAAGGAVGAVRGLVEALVVEFVQQVIENVVVFGLAAFVTFGGSLAAGAVRVVLAAIDLAADIARRISDLLDTLSDMGHTAERLVDTIRELAGRARTGGATLAAAGQDVLDAADERHVGDIVDAGTEFAAVGREWQGWTQQERAQPPDTDW